MFLRSTRLNPFTLNSNKCLPQKLLQNRELSIKSAEQLPPIGQSGESTQPNHLSPAESVSAFGSALWRLLSSVILIETNSVFCFYFWLLFVQTKDAITDTFGRVHTYLRISLTERCNLRCM